MVKGQLYVKINCVCHGEGYVGPVVPIYFGIVTKCKECGREYRADVCRGCGREPLGECKIGCPSAAPPATCKSGG